MAQLGIQNATSASSVARKKLSVSRPSHLQIPSEPKMARAAICRRAICGNVAEKRNDTCLLFDF